MSTPTGQQRISWGISLGLWPGAPQDPHFLPGGVGPRSSTLIFDFTASGSNGAAISDTFFLDETGGDFGSIQGVYIDNSNNSANNFTITFGNTLQKISAAKNTQGIYPVITTTPCTFIAQSAGLVLVPCIFLNMPVATLTWPAS